MMTGSKRRRRLSKKELELEKLRDFLRRGNLIKKERPICNYCGRPVGSCHDCKREMGLA